MTFLINGYHMNLRRRQFLAAVAAAAGVSTLDGFGFFGITAEARTAARLSTGTPSRNLSDYPHITDAIPSKDLARYFPLIVDACADPRFDYLATVPFLIELEVAKIWSESRFEWDALSAAGAAGLQQLMDATAREHGLTVAATPELERLSASIAEYRNIRTATAAQRQALYRLAESGTGDLAGTRIGEINAARAGLTDLEAQRTAAYENLKTARAAYVKVIRAMSVEERRETDARFVPERHIPAGVRHLYRNIMDCTTFFGGSVEMNVWRGVAAYNAGLTRVRTWGGLPFIEETVHFTRNVVSDLTRALEMKYAYAAGDPALVAETRKRIRLREPYFMYVVTLGDTFFRIVREQLMERYDLSYSEALPYIRDADGNTVDPQRMSVILPDQQFRIYVPR